MEIAIIFLIVCAGVFLLMFGTKLLLKGIKDYKEEVVYEIATEEESDDDDDDADYWKK